MKRNAVILASGAYVPKRILTNGHFDKALGENVSNWLENYLHIK